MYKSVKKISFVHSDYKILTVKVYSNQYIAVYDVLIAASKVIKPNDKKISHESVWVWIKEIDSTINNLVIKKLGKPNVVTKDIMKKIVNLIPEKKEYPQLKRFIESNAINDILDKVQTINIEENNLGAENINRIGSSADFTYELQKSEDAPTVPNKKLVTIIDRENDSMRTNKQISYIQSISFKFTGEFEGKELRITEDKKWISIYDIIKITGQQSNEHKTWKDVKDKYSQEIINYEIEIENIKFAGSNQKNTPCTNVQGLVKLLFWIPGEKAKRFRESAANILIRYLGGDTTLITVIF